MLANMLIFPPLHSASFSLPARVCQVRCGGRVMRLDEGLLLRSLQPSDSGLYVCSATEKGFKHVLARLQLVVLSSGAVSAALVTSGQTAPPLQTSASQYRDLLTILSQPEMGLINQYCQDYWSLGDTPQGGARADLKEQRKPRSRRHHEGSGLSATHTYSGRSHIVT